MIYPRGRVAAITALVLLLTACATSPRLPVDSDAGWRRQQQQLGALTVWQLAGRMSVQLKSDGWSASLYWWQDHDKYRLRIVAPLGRGTVEIAGDRETVSLHTSDNRVFTDDDIDALMRENLGWEVPVDALVYWIRGLPAPGKSAEDLQLDESGRLIAVAQSGWDIRYERYTRTEGYEVPVRMILQREQLRLRLNINRWTFL